MQQDCKLLTSNYVLKPSDDKLRSQKLTFIQDRAHLESFLGLSNESWFESLTAQQIQSNKPSSTKPRWSIVNSPCSPSLSQLLQRPLIVGASPTGLRHSSPAPYCDKEESFNARLSLGTPQSDGWERPLLDLSPRPSPIVQNRSVLSHPSSSRIHSLGVDDSSLSWTNSLATPPRDLSQNDESLVLTPESTCKTKDTARALFSPGCRLDSSVDSVQPLDSTFEDDQSNFESSTCKLSKSSVTPANKSDNQSCNEPRNRKPSSKVPLSQEVPRKETEDVQCSGDTKQKENNNFKKRLLSRKGSLTESSKKFKFRNRDTRVVIKDRETETTEETDSASVKNTDDDSQNYSLSPTFSQKGNRSKAKGRKSPSVSSRYDRSSIDYILSDFFDPPAASVGKRKPAPSRKRKSFELDESVASDNESIAEISQDIPDSGLNASTPKVSLQSILASDKKNRNSSTKKVRFSDHVKKCTFIPEHSTSTKRRTEKKSLGKKKSCTKANKSNNAHLSEFRMDNDLLDLGREKDDLELENSQEVKRCRKSLDGHKIEVKCQVKSKTSKNRVSPPIKAHDSGSDKQECNVSGNSDSEKSNISKKAMNRDKVDKERSDNGLGLKEISNNSEEDLFSQVSPSVLDEMCNEAETSVSCKVNDSKIIKTKESNKIQEKQPKLNKLKRLFYSSVSPGAGSTSPKLFQYKESDVKETDRKVLVNSVKYEDIVNKGVEHSDSTIVEVKEDKSSREENDEVPHALPDECSTMKTAGLQCLTEIKETLPKKEFKLGCGFQSAAGRPVSIPKQALDKAATLLLDEGRENNSVSPLSCQINDTNRQSSCQEMKQTEHSSKIDSLGNKVHLKGELGNVSNYSGALKGLGFSSASGKTMTISSEALGKAACVFDEEISFPKLSRDFKSSVQSPCLKVADNKSDANLRAEAGPQLQLNSNIQYLTVRNNTQINESETKLNRNVGEAELMTGLTGNVSKGFQLASGKDISVPELALQKAAGLLHDENIIQSPFKKITAEKKQETMVEIENEAGIADALLEDIEFSEWCEEEMEPDESIHIQAETKRDLNNDCCEVLDLPSSSAFENRETVLTDTISVDTADSNAKSENMTNKHEETETKEANMNGKALTEEAEANPGRDCSTSSSFLQARFDGFQTAGGRSLALSAEKLKHAQKLLQDNDSKDSSSLNVEFNFSNKKTVTPASETFHQTSEFKTEKKNECLSLGLPWSEKGSSSTCTTIERPSKLSVADRLKFEFEKQLSDGNCNESLKCFEDELKDLENLKKKTQCQVEKQETPLIPSRSSFLKQKSSCANVPQGFRPFKPPKVTGLCNSEKYPQTVVKNWDCKDTGSDSSLPNKISEKCLDAVKHIDVKSTTSKNIVYSESRQNQWSLESDKRSCQETAANVQKDKIQNSTNIETHGSPLNLCSMENKSCDKIVIGDTNTTGMTDIDLQGMSEMFDDDMDFTQINSTDLNEDQRKENSEHKNEGIDILLKETDISEIEEKKTHCITDGLEPKTENLETSELVEIDTLENNFDTDNLNYNSSKSNTDFGGFTTSSGRLLETSGTVVDLPVKMLSLSDEQLHIVEKTHKTNGTETGVTECDSVASSDNLDSKNRDDSGLGDSGNRMTEVTLHQKSMSACELIETIGSDLHLDTNSVSENSIVKCSEDESSKSVSDVALISGKRVDEKSLGENKTDVSHLGAFSRNTVEQDQRQYLAECDGLNIVPETGMEFKGFSTASGNKVEVSETALKHAKQHLFENDSLNTVPETGLKFPGFSTASGNKVQVSETALKHAKQHLSENDSLNTVPESGMKFPGFSTASGNKVEVSETALKHAKQHLSENDSLNTVPETGLKFPGFSTASGTKVEVSETALKHAKHHLSENDSLNTVPESGMKFPGFSTASGNKVEVSETALKHAKQHLSENDSLNTVPETGMKFPGFSTASGNKVEMSETALKHAKQHLSENDSLNTVPETGMKFPGFSTASGNKVEVSETALKHAKQHLSQNDSLDTAPESGMKFAGFSTASGNKVEVSETALKHAKQHLSENDSLNTVPETGIKFAGFSTASGNKVVVSETALKHAKHHLSENDSLDTMPKPGMKFPGFSTASGNKVEVSETALKHAKQHLSENESLDTAPESGMKFAGFSTASGNKVEVSETALKHAKQHLSENECLNTAPESGMKFPGFSTASGNKVEVSETALKHAKQHLSENESLDTAPESGMKFPGFSTASGNKVEVSETALKHAKQHLSENESLNTAPESGMKFPGFSTASGNKVEVSETALKHAKQHLSENESLDTAPESGMKFPGFSTASGNKVEVSETALKHAKQHLSENESLNTAPESGMKFPGFSTASGNKVEVSETALKHAKQHLSENESLDTAPESGMKFPGFSTASGNKVEVSETALKHAKQHLSENESLDTAPESGMKFPGFSTASGNKVEVSETALKHAKQHLPGNESLDTAPESGMKFPGFSTASGNKVEVSDTALKHAKQHLSDNDSVDTMPGTGVKFAGFSTASGNNVEMSETALKHAKQHLSENDGLTKAHKDESKFTAFSTASGKTVDISELALKVATESLHENKKSDSMTNQQYDQGTIELSIQGKISSDMVADVNISEAEVGETDLEELFGMAFKRRKLDMNRERKLLQNSSEEESVCKRKAVKNAHRLETDTRHPGFRPFKPVFCKPIGKQAERPNNASSKPGHTVTSSFQAPYKTAPEKFTSTSRHSSLAKQEVKEVTPLNIPKEMLASNLGEGDGEVAMPDVKTDLNNMLPSGDHEQNNYPDGTDGIEMKEASAKTGCSDNALIDKQVTNSVLRDGSVQEIHCNGLSKQASLISVNVPGIKEVFRKDEDLVKPDVSEGGQASDHGEFDSFSQDEDDVYYCTLVEARRHQEDIIKQRAAARARPKAGKLWEMKQAGKRWNLKDLIDNIKQQPSRDDIHVTSESAVNHRFSMESHYGKNTAHVMVGDGAYMVPNDSAEVGKHEVYRAFLTMEGVDSKLISESWVYNHYRWIVWKLAAYERTSTHFRNRCLTPDMLILQLKYRYDREIDLSQRSAVKKIYERDDTPSKRLVLCVAAIKGSNSVGSTGDQSSLVMDEKVTLELTDGWYSIPAQLDLPLTQLVGNGKIMVGQKLCLTGADLIGGEDACTPLEAPASVMLRISRNSTRPAVWDSILGYQSDPRPLCVPLSDLHGEGGTVGVVDVVIVRKYPTLFMEKFEGGGCIFRTGRCEDRARQEYESRKQTEMEKLYRQLEDAAEKEQRQESKVRRCGKYSRTDVENMQTGQDIYEAMELAAQPDMVQNYLSEQQLGMLYEYQRQAQADKQMELGAKFQRAWQEKSEVFPERVVTPVLKFRIAGCANKDLDENTSTLLTVWRPASEISDMQEGHRYKIYSLADSLSRSKYAAHTVQLTATKQTRFRRMQLDENILDRIYEPREVLWVSDIKRRQPPYGEFDFVGIIVKIARVACNERLCDTVYLADCQSGVLAVRFWNGFKGFGEDLFMVGNVLCCCNLMDKSPYRSPTTPTVEISPEFTQITNKSQTAAQRKALDKLLAVSRDRAAFLEKANALLDQLQNENINMNIPQKILDINSDFIDQFPKRNSSRQSVNSCQRQAENLHQTVDVENSNCALKLQDAGDLDDINTQMFDTSQFSEDEASNSDKLGDKSADIKSEISELDNVQFNPDPSLVSTPVIERKRTVAQAKMARLMTYGSPSVLSPLNTTVPKAVFKGFKPPAFKKL